MKAVYIKREITQEQKSLLINWEKQTGFELIGTDEFDAGEITLRDLWDKNMNFLHS